MAKKSKTASKAAAAKSSTKASPKTDRVPRPKWKGLPAAHVLLHCGQRDWSPTKGLVVANRLGLQPSFGSVHLYNMWGSGRGKDKYTGTMPKLTPEQRAGIDKAAEGVPDDIKPSEYKDGKVLPRTEKKGAPKTKVAKAAKPAGKATKSAGKSAAKPKAAKASAKASSKKAPKASDVEKAAQADAADEDDFVDDAREEDEELVGAGAED